LKAAGMTSKVVPQSGVSFFHASAFLRVLRGFVVNLLIFNSCGEPFDLPWPIYYQQHTIIMSAPPHER
jgi:hypothetical protein